VRLEKAFQELIHRHESFRTSFKMINDEPVQVIHPEVDFQFEKISPVIKEEYNKLNLMNLMKEFIRPFDLSKAPLLRAGLFTTKDNISILLTDMHHIISDGISMEIFKKELSELYDSRLLPPLSLQYKDYAEWQYRENRKEKLRNQENYWLEKFQGEIPVLNLPIDHPRPAIQSFQGNTYTFEIDRGQTGVLTRWAEREQQTLFMMLCGLYTIFLSKLSGQEDIVVGTPAAGRRHANLENIIGMFLDEVNVPDEEAGSLLTEDDSKALITAARDLFAGGQINSGNYSESLVTAIKEKTSFKGKKLFHPVRALITGRLKGPDLDIAIPLIGFEKCEKRIQYCYEHYCDKK